MVGRLSILTALVLSSCAATIPKFDRKIYSLDIETQTLRYKGDREKIDLTDPRADGSVVFLPDDFSRFVEIYVGGCEKWDPDLEKTKVWVDKSK